MKIGPAPRVAAAWAQKGKDPGSNGATVGPASMREIQPSAPNGSVLHVRVSTTLQVKFPPASSAPSR